MESYIRISDSIRRIGRRQCARALLLAFAGLLTATSPAGAGPIQLTKSNFVSATSGKPVIAYVYFPCGIGEGLLRYAFHDVKGVHVAALNVRKPAPFSHRDYNLGTVFLIHKGKILAHKKPEPIRDKVGTTYLRVWAYKALKENGFPGLLPRPDPLLVDPAREGATAVNLDRGLIGYFDFAAKGNRKHYLQNRAAGAVGDFYLRTDSGNFALHDGTLRGNGDYFTGGDSPRAARYSLRRPEIQKVMSEGFTIHFNYKPITNPNNKYRPGASFGAILLSHHARFGVSHERFILHLSSGQKQGSVHMAVADEVYISDEKVEFNKWYGVVIRFDFRAGRVSFLINGERTKDVVLSQLWTNLLGKNVREAISFLYGGNGSVLGGSVDNLAFYDRPLAASEMRAVYRKFKRDTGLETETETIDLSALNQDLLRAAYDGNLEQATNALQRGADVNSTSRGWTPLMYAAYFNRLSMARLLLSRGANPHVQKQGWNAQQMATHKGYDAMASLLESQLLGQRFCDCQLGLPEYKAREIRGPAKP